MGASTPPGVGTGLAYNSIGLGRSLAQPVAIQAPAGGAALLTATMASITGGAGPLSFLLGIVCGVFLVLIFAELARPFGSAGAVYAYAGLMAGVNFAFVIGWIYVLMMMALWSGTLSPLTVVEGKVAGLLHGPLAGRVRGEPAPRQVCWRKRRSATQSSIQAVQVRPPAVAALIACKRNPADGQETNRGVCTRHRRPRGPGVR